METIPRAKLYEDGVAFGLTIFEVAERVEATRDAKGSYVRGRGLEARPKDTSRSTRDLRHLPNSRLVVFAHSPYRHVNWPRYWHEQTRGQLRVLVPDIVSVLEQMAPDIASRAHAADAKAKEDARVRGQEELEKARVATEKRRSEAAAASRKDFLQLVEQWALAERAGSFCAQLTELLPADRKRVIPAPRSGYAPRFSALCAGWLLRGLVRASVLEAARSLASLRR